MSVMDWIRSQMDPADYVLTDEEFQAVYDWINAEKDSLPHPLKAGLLKLLNGEEYRRAFPDTRS